MHSSHRPPRSRLLGPVEQVAPTILGATLSHAGVMVRITEVEAYAGERDPASHAYRGETVRNAVMFGPPGHLYVYFTYGMHHACNVVCGPAGIGTGALVRAGEVVAGQELARARRGARVRDRDLARGPGRLAQALGITLADGGADLFGEGPSADQSDTSSPGVGGARLILDAYRVDGVMTGPRVGVSVAADVPWRFWIAGDPYVSDYKRSPRALTPTASKTPGSRAGTRQPSGESAGRRGGLDN